MTMTDSAALTLRAKMLGAIIREARTEAHLSLSEAAEMIGTTRGILSAYEHGRRIISLPELELLAFHLDTPLDSLIAPTAPEKDERDEFDPEVFLSLRQRIIGALVRKRRSDTGMTMKALAESIGISSRSMGSYERGEKSIPFTDLELIVEALGQSIEDYIDDEGPVGEWLTTNKAFKNFMDFSPEIREFLCKPGNETYVQIAKQLSEIPVEKLRILAETLLDITL
jgi:transcriptional regulator with XRE-family HTH domain